MVTSTASSILLENNLQSVISLQIREKTQYGTPWRQSTARSRISPDNEVKQIMTPSGARPRTPQHRGFNSPYRGVASPSKYTKAQMGAYMGKSLVQ